MDIPIYAAENVEGCEAKGILISPMYIYNKNAAALWGGSHGLLRNLCDIYTTHLLLSHNYLVLIISQIQPTLHFR